jgi:hypothetical protein
LGRLGKVFITIIVKPLSDWGRFVPGKTYSFKFKLVVFFQWLVRKYFLLLFWYHHNDKDLKMMQLLVTFWLPWSSYTYFHNIKIFCFFEKKKQDDFWCYYFNTIVLIYAVDQSKVLYVETYNLRPSVSILIFSIEVLRQLRTAPLVKYTKVFLSKTAQMSHVNTLLTNMVWRRWYLRIFEVISTRTPERHLHYIFQNFFGKHLLHENPFKF